MIKVIASIRALLFRMKWIFMSPEAKYAYFWKRNMSREYALGVVKIKDQSYSTSR